ncbi:MAG: hypothetical protein ACLGIZ_11665 [Acidimicrobiia bacterium]|jgi:hypothetical protein
MRDESYDRPLVEPDNMLTGGFQTGRFDAGPNPMTGRSAARWALFLAVLWLGGIGSLVALGLGALSLSSGDVGSRHKAMAIAALVLAVVGLIATFALFLSS